jgi:putative component of membrane protein insertase Oxa1/YidC/SpoIIIJ protein YidD|tara:strand:- start:528 stop:659 length:132 start_codon:yes stop_codon:yes gene_type:complete
MKEAIETHGLVRGLSMGMKRISHCHPFKVLGSKEGYDPVPPKE